MATPWFIHLLIGSVAAAESIDLRDPFSRKRCASRTLTRCARPPSDAFTLQLAAFGAHVRVVGRCLRSSRFRHRVIGIVVDDDACVLRCRLHPVVQLFGIQLRCHDVSSVHRPPWPDPLTMPIEVTVLRQCASGTHDPATSSLGILGQIAFVVGKVHAL